MKKCVVDSNRFIFEELLRLERESFRRIGQECGTIRSVVNVGEVHRETQLGGFFVGRAATDKW